MMSNPGDGGRSYVLLTAAHNEAPFIAETIKSVRSQADQPAQWVIVSDGSNDGTDEIISEEARHWPVITPVRRERDGRRDFASKVQALSLGFSRISLADYSFIGHVDADVTFDGDYFERLIAHCLDNPSLGLCGGAIYEQRNCQFRPRPYNSLSSVAGAVQFFRRKCYEQVGGLPPISTGGEDTYAEVKARMMGWQVRSFPDLIVRHNKASGSRGLIAESIRKGAAAYGIGNHPLFEFGRCIYRVAEPPYIVGSILRFATYLFAELRREKREVGDEFVRYVRREQTDRMKHAFLRRLPWLHGASRQAAVNRFD